MIWVAVALYLLGYVPALLWLMDSGSGSYTKIALSTVFWPAIAAHLVWLFCWAGASAAVRRIFHRSSEEPRP